MSFSSVVSVVGLLLTLYAPSCVHVKLLVSLSFDVLSL